MEGSDMIEITNDLIDQIYLNEKHITEDVSWFQHGDRYKLTSRISCHGILGEMKLHGYWNSKYKKLALNITLNKQDIIRYDTTNHPPDYQPTGELVQGPHKHKGSKEFQGIYRVWSIPRTEIDPVDPNRAIKEFFREINIHLNGKYTRIQKNLVEFLS